MRRFFENFAICQAVPDKSKAKGKSQAVPDKFVLNPILQAQPIESLSPSLEQVRPDELPSTKTPDKPMQKRQAPPAESKVPLLIDFIFL